MCVGLEIRPRDVVVRSDFHAAKATEKALRLIGASDAVRIGDRVIDTVRVELGVKIIPVRSLVRVDSRHMVDVCGHQLAALRFRARHDGERLTATLAANDNDLALAGLVDGKATIAAVAALVSGPDVTAKIGAVQLDFAGQGATGILKRHCFAQLVREDEGGLVLNIKVAAHLKRADTLCAVHENDDGSKQVGVGQLARSEDRAAGDAELVVAGDALKLAAGADVISFRAAATRTNRLAIGIGPAQIAEHTVSGILAHLEHFREGEGAGFGGEEKVLCHCHHIQCLCTLYGDNTHCCKGQSYRI